MYITKHNKWVAVLCMAALAGCASDRMSDSSSSANTGYTAPGTTATSSTAGTGSPSSTGTGETGSSTAGTGTGTGSMGTTGSMGSSGSPGTMGSTASAGDTSAAQTSYGTVQAIDQMQRQDVGAGAVGAAAAGGTLGGSPTDRVYRVTVRMDDGSSQLVVVDSMPGYKIGDRVRYNNGTLTPY